MGPPVSDLPRMSFAKVAASGTGDKPTLAAGARTAAQTKPAIPTKAIATPAMPSLPVDISQPSNLDTLTAAAEAPEAAVVEGLKELKIETKTPSLVVNGTGSGSVLTERSSKNGNSQTPSDENSHRADSASELGTKPPSLDGKSITSGTTFALDEKESLRPDDSASVKAAAEDDDAFSIRGSLIAPGSRMGSEVAGRFRIQLGDMPPRTISHHISHELGSQEIVTPASGDSEKQPVPEAQLPLVPGAGTSDGLNGNIFYSQNPDDKLLEAMQSPKDRLFLLRLEAQVINFVQDSKEPFIDLPPCNSFCRMLTHKLADYYHMTHSYEQGVGAVRIYRTPFCRVPPPLSGIVSQSASSSPAPAILPRKIMRRGEVDGIASGSPSKATSEAGSGEEKAVPKEKLTREEREEAYNKARERIFGSMEKNDTPTSEAGDSTGISRASSVSGKDKSGTNKRRVTKQRRDDSDSFETRSQFLANQSAWGAQQYIPVANAQYSAAAPYQQQQQYANTLQTIYGPNQSYVPQAPTSGLIPQYNQLPMSNQYPSQPIPQQTPPQRYHPQATPVAAYGQPVPQNGLPQGWQQQNFNQSPYQSRVAPAVGLVAPVLAGAPGPGPTPSIPYPFGQLPGNVDPKDPKSQHPIPGSYNRNGFNPKTQSFVPGSNGLPPMPAIGTPYGGQGAPGPHHGSPQFSHNAPAHMKSPHMNYAGYQQPMMPQSAYPPNGSGYGMVRQGSNSSLPPYHHPLPQMPPQQQHQRHVPHNLHQGPIHGLPPNPTMHNMPNKPNMSGGPGAYNTLANYGNPATLPQKPTA